MIVLSLSLSCSFCVVVALPITTFSKFVVEVFSCRVVSRRVGVGRVGVGCHVWDWSCSGLVPGVFGQVCIVCFVPVQFATTSALLLLLSFSLVVVSVEVCGSSVFRFVLSLLFLISVHADLSRGFCTSAVWEQSPANEYVVKLLALFGCVVRGLVVVLLFVSRVGQRQLVLGCPVSEPRASPALLSECVSSDVFGIDCFWFVVCSDLRVEVSADQYVCVPLPAPVTVCFWLGVHLLRVLVFVSRMKKVDFRDLQSELVLHDGASCESRSRVLHFFDVLGPPLVDESCCSMARVVDSCYCESVSLFRRP